MNYLFYGLLLFSLSTKLIFAAPSIDNTASNAAEASLPIPSSRAQTLYKAARNDLLQIRVLLKNGRTQSSVGSGFLIGTSNLVVTNYHVVSQIVMHPANYVGEFVDTNGQRGTVKLVSVDALHDLAVVQVNRNGTGYFNVPEALPTLTQGQYLYSLGNPLDLGFAISEGAYNGVIRRGFYNQLMFTGPINAGMSGGPNITQEGRVAGVNVAKRLDGELVSFLVPVEYVRDVLIEARMKLAQKKPTETNFKLIVGQQLLKHQDNMINNILAHALSLKKLGDYQVPVRESDQVRCWGSSDDNKQTAYDFSSIQCLMESAIYVSDQLQVGQIAIRHEYVKSKTLDSLRFSVLQSQSFENEQFGTKNETNLTAPSCQEAFVNNQKLPMRAVLCIRAYREFDEIFDFALLTATTDRSLEGVQSRLDVKGVSYENGLKITRLFLESFDRQPARIPLAKGAVE